MKKFKYIVIILIVVTAGAWLAHRSYEQKVLQEIIARLEADSRAAEVLVVGVNYNEEFKKNFTTIKFLEYDTHDRPLAPRYFIFPGNVIQFQSLVVRFDDRFVAAGDALKGKSVYLFWKAFMLDGEKTKEYPIAYLNEIPGGYKIMDNSDVVEQKFWRRFWDYAFDKEAAHKAGIKNVQIEAPGAVFIPGYFYTIKIEHDGGLRIDTKPLPDIVRGERVL